MAIQELASIDMKTVGGGANWNEFQTGLGLVGLGLGIAATTPLGWVGIGTATGLSYFGGTLISDGFWNDGLIWGEYFQ